MQERMLIAALFGKMEKNVNKSTVYGWLNMA